LPSEKTKKNTEPVGDDASTGHQLESFLRKEKYEQQLKDCTTLIAFYQIDQDWEGFHYKKSKIAKTLGVSKRTVNRLVLELVKRGILKVVSRAYDTSKHTMRYNFAIEQKIDIPRVVELQRAEAEKEEESYRNKIKHNIKGIDCERQDILDEITRTVININRYSAIPLSNSCRYEEWTSGKKRIRHHIDYSGRVSSSLCYTKSGKKKSYSPHNHMPFRHEYLEACGLHNYTEVYDIRSEIPRMTAFWNGMHDWNEIEDYYTHFLKESGLFGVTSRALVKSLFMRGYFEPNSAKNAWRLCKRARRKICTDLPNPNEWITEDQFNSLYYAIKKINPLGNFVFVLTSLLETKVIDAAHINGLNIVNVYDGFYCESGAATKEEIAAIIKSEAEKILKEFNKEIYNKKESIKEINNKIFRIINIINNEINNKPNNITIFSHVDTKLIHAEFIPFQTPASQNSATFPLHGQRRSIERSVEAFLWNQ
jgi:DNA-binding Lrp family transcriptional regulator